jgi:hypothetical protein
MTTTPGRWKSRTRASRWGPASPHPAASSTHAAAAAVYEKIAATMPPYLAERDGLERVPTRTERRAPAPRIEVRDAFAARLETRERSKGARKARRLRA